MDPFVEYEFGALPSPSPVAEPSAQASPGDSGGLPDYILGIIIAGAVLFLLIIVFSLFLGTACGRRSLRSCRRQPYEDEEVAQGMTSPAPPKHFTSPMATAGVAAAPPRSMYAHHAPELRDAGMPQRAVRLDVVGGDSMLGGDEEEAKPHSTKPLDVADVDPSLLEMEQGERVHPQPFTEPLPMLESLSPPSRYRPTSPYTVDTGIAKPSAAGDSQRPVHTAQLQRPGQPRPNAQPLPSQSSHSVRPASAASPAPDKESAKSPKLAAMRRQLARERAIRGLALQKSNHLAAGGRESDFTESDDERYGVFLYRQLWCGLNGQPLRIALCPPQSQVQGPPASNSLGKEAHWAWKNTAIIKFRVKR